MNIESVKSLFRLFSGEDDIERYTPFIELAITETKKMLLPDADNTDVRLSFLSAAIANHRFVQFESARDRTQITYGGKMLTGSSETLIANSEKLLRDYLEICSDLISPRIFTFTGV